MATGETGVDDIRVASWNELTDLVYEGAWNPALCRYRSNWAFRGVPGTAFDLTTGLARLGGDVARLEAYLLRNFRKYAGRDAVPGDSVWNWLARGQHHGLPTRLLDWTYSPYVAMHFATDDLAYYHLDSTIWCIDYVAVNQALPDGLKDALAGEGANAFTTEMLADVAGSLPELDALAPTPFVVFLEPPSLDERIVNQYALFSLMSSPTAALHEWLTDHPRLFRRLIIPADVKWEVRDKLDQANITERVLFPGLDGLSRWLRRYYTPRTGAAANGASPAAPLPAAAALATTGAARPGATGPRRRHARPPAARPRVLPPGGRGA
ncbi:MAG TPA: FRG domain-containing protein [Chloroflexota bacterium]|nr:FRG domain-containing protein [Chloroflexota bacterium]